jgi:hypothetical protein
VATESILDVVSRVLGDGFSKRDALTITEQDLTDLEVAVSEFYDRRWHLPAVGPDEFRAYSGGWIAGNPGTPEARATLHTTLLYAHAVVVHDPVAEWLDRARSELEPLERIGYENARSQRIEIAGSEAHMVGTSGYRRSSLEQNQLEVARRLQTLAELAPLVLAGIAIPIPHVRLWVAAQSGILSATRHSVRDARFSSLVRGSLDPPPPRADSIRGGDVTGGPGMRLSSSSD